MKNDWVYTGTKQDRYMWALKKDAQKRGSVRKDGWPTLAYLEEWRKYADRLLDAGFELESVYGKQDYTLRQLWQDVDAFLYRCSLDFGRDVLGRPSTKIFASWFK